MASFARNRSSNRFAALSEEEPHDALDAAAVEPRSCLHGFRNPQPADSETYDKCLLSARAAVAARRAREVAEGSPPPPARGLRAPRPRGTPRRVQLSSLLLTDPAEGLLAAVGSGLAPGEKVIEVVVDSGAVQSVAPPGLFPGTMEPSAMSRAGRTYRAANGSQIRNLGQVRVPFVSPEGHKCSFPFQVAEVEHALLSVGHLAAAGNKVELHDKGGLITNVASGKTMALTRRGGVYVLRLRVSGFPRPGAGR